MVPSPPRPHVPLSPWDITDSVPPPDEASGRREPLTLVSGSGEGPLQVPMHEQYVWKPSVGVPEVQLFETGLALGLRVGADNRSPLLG